MAQKIGRNAACPCASGLKFKMEILTERYEQAINDILDFATANRSISSIPGCTSEPTLDGIRTDRRLRRDPDGLAQMTCCPRR